MTRWLSFTEKLMTTNGRGSNKPTIILIHGLWLTPRSWEHWIDRYQKLGYNVMAPSWPGLEGEVEALRRDPTPLKGLKLSSVIDHYVKIITKLPRPPILMGHSFGGLIVQVLLDRGLGAAGVGIDAAATAGVLNLPLSQLRSSFPILGNPFSLNKAVALTPDQFNYAFTNELDPVASKKVYDRYAIPGAAHILWEAAFSTVNPNAASRVNYANNARAPLLFIAGGQDHTVPASVNRANVRKYINSTNAVTDYREFPNRTHHTVGQAGWEEVADFALQWASQHAIDQVNYDDVKSAFAPRTTSSTTRGGEVRA
jgi:pimeloyl-ACP methyl ester carboxylesterase